VATVDAHRVPNPVMPPRAVLPSFDPGDLETFVNAHPLNGFRFGQDGPARVTDIACLSATQILERMGWSAASGVDLPDDRAYCLAVLSGRFGFAGPLVSGRSGDLVCPTAYLLLDAQTHEVLSQGLLGTTMPPRCQPRA
jgi:hypothetical protein